MNVLEGELSVSDLCNYCKKSLTFGKGENFKTGVAANKIYALENMQEINFRFFHISSRKKFVEK